METCEWRISQLHRLAEGELGQEEASKLTEHVQTCPRCAEQLREFEDTKKLVEDNLAAEFELPEVAALVTATERKEGSMRFAVSSSGGLFKKAIFGMAACTVGLVLATGLFLYLYFQKTFPYELDRTVFRCSKGIQVKKPNSEWQPLRVGTRLDKGTCLKTLSGTQSFASFDGIRLLTDGEAQVKIEGLRSLSLESGEAFIAATKRTTPLAVMLGNASISTHDGAFKLARSPEDVSVGVTAGKVTLATAAGETHDLIQDQSIALKGKDTKVMFASARIKDPFASLKVPVVDRIRERFDRVMSKYIPGYKTATHTHLHEYDGLAALQALSGPQEMYQFASYSPAGSLRYAGSNATTLNDYYESLFVPSNRSLSIGKQRLVYLRPGRRPSFPQWSHDGSMIAYVEHDPNSPDAIIRVVRLDDLKHPWDISQGDKGVLPFLPLTWAPDNRHVLYMVANLEIIPRRNGYRWYWRAPYKIRIAPIDPEEGSVRDFLSPFHDIPLKLPLPVGKTISPRIVKLPWGDAMLCCNWGNIGYIPVEEDGQAVPGAPGLFITDFDPHKMFVMMAVWSPSADKILFGGFENFDFDGMNDSHLYILYDVQDILDGFSEPPRSLDDPRIKWLAPTDAVEIPGGFSFDESLVFYDEDVNDAWNPNYPTDIYRSDFDLFYANALPDQPAQPTQIHLPGNQLFLTPSPEGNRVALCTHVHGKYALRIISFDIEADMDVDLGGILIDNSGTNLIVPPGTLEENFKVQITTPFTVEEEATIPEDESHFFAMRLLDAQGLENPKFIEPMTLTIRYTDDEVAGLDESMLDIYYYDESDPEKPTWVPLGATVDAEHNELTVEIQHFSKFSVGRLDKSGNNEPLSGK